MFQIAKASRRKRQTTFRIVIKYKVQTHVGFLEKSSRSAAFSLAVFESTPASDVSLISRTQFPSDSSVLA